MRLLKEYNPYKGLKDEQYYKISAIIENVNKK